MTQSLFAALVICSMAGPVSSQAPKPNFTGQLESGCRQQRLRSDASAPVHVHVIDHKEPNVKIATTTKSEMRESTSEQDSTTEREPQQNAAMGTQQEVKVTARWDGEKLATSWSFEAKGPRSTLATLGHSLTVKRS
jgi:hypothetical protein